MTDDAYFTPSFCHYIIPISSSAMKNIDGWVCVCHCPL